MGETTNTTQTVPFLCIRVLVLLLSFSCLSEAKWYDRRRYDSQTVTVDPSGYGNFSKIQSAIDSVPQNNKVWFFINVKAGLYREKVQIPYDKPHIVLNGEGTKTTKVVWDDHESIAQSPTFASFADYTIVKSMSFVNSYNLPSSGKNVNPIIPAVAAYIGGDKSAFYQVGFEGVQDTLWDCQGRHFFYGCTILGAVDFIFGGGQSIYQSCEIQVQDIGAGFVGYITAQGRTHPKESNGFVFKYCVVHGTGMAYLGRAWRAYSRVIFYKTNLSNVVVPAGWDPWSFGGHEYQLTYAEYGCVGAGSDTSQRVKWEKNLSKDSVEKLASLRFINREDWIKQLPTNKF